MRINKLPKRFYMEELIYSTQRRTLATNLHNLTEHFNCWKKPNTVEFTNGLILTFEDIQSFFPDIKKPRNLIPNE